MHGAPAHWASGFVRAPFVLGTDAELVDYIVVVFEFVDAASLPASACVTIGDEIWQHLDTSLFEVEFGPFSSFLPMGGELDVVSLPFCPLRYVLAGLALRVLSDCLSTEVFSPDFAEVLVYIVEAAGIVATFESLDIATLRFWKEAKLASIEYR